MTTNLTEEEMRKAPFGIDADATPTGLLLATETAKNSAGYVMGIATPTYPMTRIRLA